ncbi:MAG TPA: NAD(P)-binding domain-containing protein [Ktedonobacteraceae bacterium]
MNITIIGTGKMARGIGTRLVAGGNSVTLLSRNPEKGADLAANLQAAARKAASAQAVPFGSPIQDEVVVLAVPYNEVAETLQPYTEQLTGKILVDITNPVNATFDGLATPPDSSAAQEIASLVPAETRVVKAFNTTFAGPLVKGQVAGQPLDVFITGDDDAAKGTVSQLVEAGGLRVIDAGPLAHAHYLEGLAFLGMKLQSTLGTQFQSAWKFLS